MSRNPGGSLVSAQMIESTFQKDQKNFLYNIATDIIKSNNYDLFVDQTLTDDVYFVIGSIAIQFGLELMEVIRETENADMALATIKKRLEAHDLKKPYIQTYLEYISILSIEELTRKNDDVKSYAQCEIVNISQDVQIKIKKLLSSLIIPINLAVPVYEMKRVKNWTYESLFKLNKIITEESKFDGKESIKAFENLYADTEYGILMQNTLRFIELGKLSIVFYDMIITIKEHAGLFFDNDKDKTIENIEKILNKIYE
jgi:hypothetical protein